ncbi:chorismate--pyruvate lyase family protein [Herbaspirillum rubrisubalbicans]|uniref:Probable chorismate pyruvate-lyase n=1 Tax=Herbaspirillum rubrisubalbicans TaxID=80842 RepID=A0AAD0XFN7_9BURK|nr:chorismate lyase [Herbaspirillum rubrisubalbicans]AYR22643.1 chorismate lyase [Herbaspirillum rubrisubalbicans]
MPPGVRTARWMAHPQALAALRVADGDLMRRTRAWLADPGSMTLKLKARTETFTVRLLRQRPGRILADEHEALCISARSRVVERDVILLADGTPVVFGHTVLSTASVKSDWPFFSKLGTTPLGANLFFDPLVGRRPIQYARLSAGHPLMRRIAQALPGSELPTSLLARRSLFTRRGGVLMVTDVFLPALEALMRPVPAHVPIEKR